MYILLLCQKSQLWTIRFFSDQTFCWLEYLYCIKQTFKSTNILVQIADLRFLNSLLLDQQTHTILDIRYVDMIYVILNQILWDYMSVFQQSNEFQKGVPFESSPLRNFGKLAIAHRLRAHLLSDFLILAIIM